MGRKQGEAVVNACTILTGCLDTKSYSWKVKPYVPSTSSLNAQSICLTLEIKECRCYESKIEESEKAGRASCFTWGRRGGKRAWYTQFGNLHTALLH